MSELLRRLVSHITQRADPRIHVVTSSNIADEEPTTLAPASPQIASAEIVEPSGKIDGVPVGEPTPSRFSYFIDGIERRRVVMYYAGVPVLYGFAASACRHRDRRERRMQTHGEPVIREALFCPKRLVGFCSEGIDVIDVEENGTVFEDHPVVLLEAAKHKVSDVRARLEAQVISSWLADFEGTDEWLLVDGSLSGDYHLYNAPNMVGVVKSHQTQYFPIEEQRKILELRVGERSGLFVPKGRKRHEVYSWYLRLWPHHRQDAYFGLVRVEAPKCERTLAMVDQICQWLLAERTPLSLPDSRWDRMLYPIRDCEQFLASLAPSKVMLDSAMMRLVAADRR
jgi:hypothetical protein